MVLLLCVHFYLGGGGGVAGLNPVCFVEILYFFAILCVLDWCRGCVGGLVSGRRVGRGQCARLLFVREPDFVRRASRSVFYGRFNGVRSNGLFGRLIDRLVDGL